MKFPMLNGQIDTEVLSEYILLKILLHIDSAVPRDKVRTMESELKEVLDQIIDNA